VIRWLRLLARRAAADRELDEEIRLHLDLETEKNIRAGLSPDEARRRAVLAFGGVAATREAHHEARGVSWLEDAAADARHALRAFRRSPALAGAAVVTLALGIGANTAIFSAVNAVILRPLPYPEAARLVSLGEDNPEYGWVHAQVAPANMLDWREQVAAFADVAGYVDIATTVTLTGEGEPKVLSSAQVTGNFFSVLGVRARVGRTLEAGESWAPGPRVAVVSDRLWRERFGANPGVIGRTVELSGRPVQVVGVLPPGFGFPAEAVDVWLPTRWDPADRDRTYFRRAHWLRAIARLRPGVTLGEAAAQLQTVVRRLQQQYPATNRVMGADLLPLHRAIVGDTGLPLLVLLGAVALLLLIACANVGNLLLAHAAGHEREAAVRLALGAGRGRLLRQALAESLVLAGLGAVAGLVLGSWGTHVLVRLQPPGMLPVRSVSVDWPVLGYVSFLAVAAGLLFGTAPAAWSGRRLPAEALKEGGRGDSAGRRMRRWTDFLVVAEVALALALTVGAGLLVRSFSRLLRVEPGFDGRGVLTVSLTLPPARYDVADKAAVFWNELVRRAGALPGVTAAAATSNLPLSPPHWSSDFFIYGREPDQYGVDVVHREVTPGYFSTMRVPLLRGRDFTEQDRSGAPPVVLINEALARAYFPNEDPLGKRVAFDRTPDSTSFWHTIVGVVGDEHQTTLTTSPKIEFIAPVAQDPRLHMTLVVRTGGAPLAVAPLIRQLVRELDPRLAIQWVRTMDAVGVASLATQRFLMTLLVVFAGTGLVLALVGVYGIMAQVAKARTREIGIRLALGAQGSGVRWLVVRYGLRLAVAGLAAGVTVGSWGARAMRPLLYDIGPGDPATFLAVSGLLLLTATAASWLPAAKASRADPATVLRAE
jgi:putative ABC transport system permease protein